ncbi:hypothetical protein CYMTET_44448 [Cymbomonas tetramitiformis]|uniref:Amino acid transporter transmembrane domain-containing protein n=1 Tax=Cymbomonas tetramitiformis TaxID=36881 RepID=A0AAE0C1F7_9CHLO|nr:hypothetical protein CYMTET_44448 [Cymbomonas tetramitiformis]
MTAKPTGGASAYACISSLMNAAIGAGVLSVPCAFSYLGIVLGPTIMLIVVCMEVSSLCILVRTAEQFTVSSYQELVLVRFGSRSADALSASLIVYIVGSCIAYLIILGDTLHPLINELVNDSDSWMYSRQTVITLITAFAVTPLSLLRTLNALTAASTSAVICLLFSTVAIAISAKDAVHDLGKGHLTEGVKMMKLDHQFIEALPILLFAFQCHIQVVQVFLELEACPSLLPWRRNDSQRWPVAQGSPGQSLLKTGGDAISRASSAENMLQPLVGEPGITLQALGAALQPFVRGPGVTRQALGAALHPFLRGPGVTRQALGAALQPFVRGPGVTRQALGAALHPPL